MKLTSVRFKSLERDRLLVLVIFILPDVVTASGADLASVVEVGHFKQFYEPLQLRTSP